MTQPDPTAAVERIRTYLRLLPNARTLGGEIAYSEEFRSEEWPRSCYAPTREDVETLLAASSAGVAPAPDQLSPSRRAGLRDEMAAALHEQMPGCTHDEHGDDCSALADAVLPVLYREWPWLRAEAEEIDLAAEEARDLADEFGTQLYRAQDALAFVEECCVIADREGRQVSTADVREWLKGARCGRQLAADARDRAALVEVAAQAIRDSNGTPEALEWWRIHPQLIPAHVYAAAVLSVLPASVDRADALDEAAGDRAARWEAAASAAGRVVDRNALRVYMAVADAEQAGLRAAFTNQLDLFADTYDRHTARIAELRRVAAETPNTTEAEPATREPIQHAPGVAILCPDCRAKGRMVCVDDRPQATPPAGGAPQPKEADGDRIVAYRLGGNQSLRCVGCAPSPRGDIWEPVTPDDLPDGGLCATCGADVLIPQPKEG